MSPPTGGWESLVQVAPPSVVEKSRPRRNAEPDCRPSIKKPFWASAKEIEARPAKVCAAVNAGVMAADVHCWPLFVVRATARPLAVEINAHPEPSAWKVVVETDVAEAGVISVHEAPSVSVQKRRLEARSQPDFAPVMEKDCTFREAAGWAV